MEPDGTLLERWRGGDADAGERLLERHFERLYLFFANKVDVDIDDLVQRTMVACVGARDRIEDAGSFRAYLFAIARRELIEYFRERGRAGRFDPATTSVCDVAPSPSRMLVDRVEQKRLLEALRRLPLDLQIVLELHYWEELPLAEVARVFDVPLGTAKSRLRRAREALSQALESVLADADGFSLTPADLDAWARSIRREVRARKR